jgi:hypothetical protein
VVSDRPSETLLEIAQRHVDEGELRVARQEALVATLIRDGHQATAARGAQVLTQMRWSLELGRRHLAFELKQASRKKDTTAQPEDPSPPAN